jgi:hypothetical protein
MAWTRISRQKLERSNREISMQRVTVSHAGNYADSGAGLEGIDFSDLFSDIAYAECIDGGGYEISANPIVGAGGSGTGTRKNALELLLRYGNYDSADGPLIEVPNGTATTITEAVLIIHGKEHGALKPIVTET